ncbi:MAG: KAP family NTPase [Prevotella sp.]|nr:KAP family NTPase [Prevotella sp.]
MEPLGDIIQQHPCINVPLFLFFLWVIYWVWKRTKQFNAYISLLYVVFAIEICRTPCGEFVPFSCFSCFCFSWKWLLLVFLVALSMIEICRLIEALRKYNKSYRGLKEGHTGFGMRTKDEELLEVGYGNYAEVMLPLLASTDLGEESFAVGVTGPWGSGKTTFLQSMKAKMGENFMVVEFTPWYSDTAESLVRDFFMCLDSKLGSMNVKADFSRYLAVLQDYDTSGTLRILNKLATFRTTIEDEKRKIEERLALIRRKVVIMIDDTDRMGKEELMELLKLIRLTANFKNVIFMVAYDKEYVLRRMKDSEIENGTEYLKKIFPLEITLPYVENSVLPQLFVQEMNRCGFEKAFVDETEKQLREKNVHGNPLLFQYVKTFRDIKNFVNSLLVGYKLIESSSVKGEYSYKDFFWMEVIHTYLPDIYDKLLNDRRLLLNIDSKNTNGGQMLVYRALPDDKDNQNDNTKRILLILFGEDNKDDKSIRRLNNYYKYFTYRLPTNVISNAEFLDFLRLNKEEDRRANINKYSEEQKIESFFYHFAEFNLGKCEEKQQVQNFMWVVIEMAEYSSPYISMETLFKSSMAANSLKLIDASYVYRLIEEHLKEKDFDSFDAWNRLLASIFSYAISVDGKKLEKYRSILSDTQIEELANLNCDNYLEYIGPQLPDISEVWIEDSDIKAFVKGAYVNLYGEPYKWSDNSKNLVFNSLVKHYSAQKEKNDRKHFIAPYEEAKHMGLEPKAMERLKKEIKTLFGSDEKLEEFIDKCFVKPDEEGKK